MAEETRNAVNADDEVYDSGMRRGLPRSIDGVPVRDTIHVFTLPRWYSHMGEPLPMVELREYDDNSKAAARWPKPFERDDILGGPS